MRLEAATYSVIDEYGVVNAAGSVTLNPDGSYSITIMLEASRKGSDKDGRHYTITIRAQDEAGNEESAAVVVIVPHDQGK